MKKRTKITYQLKREMNKKSVIDPNLDSVESLNVLADYYQTHQKAEAIESKTINAGAPLTKLSDKKEIKQALQFIDTNIHRPISLDETAKRVFLSPYYFSKLFKTETGITFIAYVNQKKMQYAAELLQHSDFSISHIAKMLGFKHASYFSRMFKEQFAKTPLEYRDSFEF